MASGHVNRTKRPNTWLHRPACGREESPCQPGRSCRTSVADQCPKLGVERTQRGHAAMAESDPKRPSTLGIPLADPKTARFGGRHLEPYTPVSLARRALPRFLE
jgi:hypothetical protein